MARTQTCSNALTDSTSFAANFAQQNTAAGGNVLVEAAVGAYGQYGLQPTNQRCSARYTGTGAPGTSQYASAVLGGASPGSGDSPPQTAGVSVLGSGSGSTRTQYEAWVVLSASTAAVTTGLAKVVNNVVTVLHSATVAWASGDRVELEADQFTTPGTTIVRVCKNGTPLGGSFTQADASSPLTSGAPGVVISGNNFRLSGWQGGDVTASPPPLSFTGTVGAQSGTVGTAFSWSGSALSTFFSGGTTPYVYSVVSGTLPAGLSLNSSTGVVSGTPTAAGSGSVTFRVTDAASGTANSNSVSFTVAAAPATATTLTGPSGGQVGVASSNFTVGANGTVAGTITVTPSATGGGTFSPTSVTISAGSPTATFTYTPASAGAKTVSIADDGGLTDAASLTYTASTAPGRMLFDGVNDEFRNNAGTLLASKSVTLHFHHATTGALVVQVGTTTDSAGLIGTVTNGALALSTNYRVDYKFATGEYGVVYRTTEAT